MTTSSFQQALVRHHGSAMAGRTAQSHAAFLLPHLSPGMSLLDIGCGPGTITLGLAEAVAPGQTHAIDLQPFLADGTGGVRVQTGTAYELPYEDATFDAVFACALLQHLEDPRAALREARRVAKPGAVIGVADADWGGSLLAPADPVLTKGFDLVRATRTGTPFVGRDLRGLLVEAGFERCEAEARAMCHGTAEEIAGFASFNASWFGNPAMVEAVVARGISTEAEMAATEAAWRAWGEQPGAFFAGFWCEALGWAA